MPLQKQELAVNLEISMPTLSKVITKLESLEYINVDTTRKPHSVSLNDAWLETL